MIEQPQQYEQEINFHYEYPPDQPPTQEQVAEAFAEALSEKIKKVESGEWEPYPLVCFFVKKDDGLETVWPEILWVKDPKMGVWRYEGIYKIALQLELRNYRKELSDTFKAHSEWFNNSVNHIVTQYSRQETRLKDYLTDRYKVTISSEDFSSWIMREYGKNLHASLSIQKDKDNGILWVTKWEWRFPDLRRTFEPSIFDEDLHRYCREVLDTQKQIEERLDKKSRPEEDTKTISSADRTALEKFVLKFKVNDYWQIEQRIKATDYFSDAGKWAKDAKALAKLLAIFQAKQFFRPDQRPPALRKFFEERYGLSIPSEYVKPSYQRAKIYPAFESGQSQFGRFFD